MARDDQEQPVTARALTPTEERVAQLVAFGRSNAEIVRELELPVKTVEWHLSRIHRKLGAHSRAELAVLAGNHGLPAGP